MLKIRIYMTVVMFSIICWCANFAFAQPGYDDITSTEMHAGGDLNKRYFLIGSEEEMTSASVKFRLLLVLPGGDGSADFNPFVENIRRYALSDHYLIAELVAKEWRSGQFNQLVWPTETNPWPGMGFSTEAFAQAVIDEIKQHYHIDEHFIFTLGWSSGGPPCYAFSLKQGSPVRGTFVAMSVFQPAYLPSLNGAAGRAYYLLHSPTDFIPISQAQQARDQLRAHGATTKLVTYTGGHGWHGDIFGQQSAGILWLEQQVIASLKSAVHSTGWSFYDQEKKK